MSSKGRTLWEILTSSPVQETSLENVYFNPLKAKIGSRILIEEDPYAGINFSVEKIAVYEVNLGKKKFYHVDYLLKGIDLDLDYPTRLNLRFVSDDNAMNKVDCTIQLLSVIEEFGYDENFFEILSDPNGEFRINQDKDGNDLEEPIVYWRVGDVRDPYETKMTVLSDEDKDGTVTEDELDKSRVTCWDYHRDVMENGEKVGRDNLWVEMDKSSRYFTILSGMNANLGSITLFCD